MFFASLTCLYLHKIFAANRLMLPFISRRDINWPNLSICACSALKSKTNNSIGFFVLQKVATQKPCLWNGMKRPCYLFARKFYPEALDNLIHLFSNYTVIWFIHTVRDLPSDDTFFKSVPHENRCRLWSSNSFGTNLDIKAWHQSRHQSHRRLLEQLGWLRIMFLSRRVKVTPFVGALHPVDVSSLQCVFLGVVFWGQILSSPFNSIQVQSLWFFCVVEEVSGNACSDHIILTFWKANLCNSKIDYIILYGLCFHYGITIVGASVESPIGWTTKNHLPVLSSCKMLLKAIWVTHMLI